MIEKKYWVRANSKVYGPYDGATIRQMAAAGTLHRDMEISPDNQIWHVAKNVPGLFVSLMRDFEAPAANAPAPRPQPTQSPVPVVRPQLGKAVRTKWILAAAAVGLFVCAMYLSGPTQLKGNPTAARPEAGSAIPKISTGQPAAAGIRIDPNLLAATNWECHSSNKGTAIAVEGRTIYAFSNGSPLTYQKFSTGTIVEGQSEPMLDVLIRGTYSIEGSTIVMDDELFATDLAKENPILRKNDMDDLRSGKATLAKVEYTQFALMPVPLKTRNTFVVREISPQSMSGDNTLNQEGTIATSRDTCTAIKKEALRMPPFTATENTTATEKKPITSLTKEAIQKNAEVFMRRILKYPMTTQLEFNDEYLTINKQTKIVALCGRMQSITPQGADGGWRHFVSVPQDSVTIQWGDDDKLALKDSTNIIQGSMTYCDDPDLLKINLP